MTSEDIHQMKLQCLDRIIDISKRCKLTPSDSIESEKLLVLVEIAFQLAKLNEHFEKVDGAVFGGTNEKKEKEK